MSLQTEKQRLIWAYKILFLDVLFPLNLRKVIFCDSDQVIRGDMADLWNMDLKVCPSPESAMWINTGAFMLCAQRSSHHCRACFMKNNNNAKLLHPSCIFSHSATCPGC